MYKPEFPFKSKQIILTSDRVTLHSKTDSVFLFGTEAVSLSSKKTINLDSVDKVSIYSPKIELGPNANQPLILSRPFIEDLETIISALKQAGTYLSQVSEGDPGASATYISKAGELVYSVCNVINIAANKNISKTTFTS